MTVGKPSFTLGIDFNVNLEIDEDGAHGEASAHAIASELLDSSGIRVRVPSSFLHGQNAVMPDDIIKLLFENTYGSRRDQQQRSRWLYCSVDCAEAAQTSATGIRSCSDHCYWSFGARNR